MNRQLVKHGPASTIVSLPAQWIRDHNLKPGDSIQMYNDGDRIIITPNTSTATNETELTVGNLDRTSLKLLIRSIYRQGYAKIIIHYTNEYVQHYRKKEQVSVLHTVLKEVQLLIGVEVIEQRKGIIVLQEITQPTAHELQILHRKAFTMVNQLILFIAEDTVDTALDIDARHDLIMKIINYAMRIINRGEANLSSAEKLRMSRTFSLLGITIDIIKYYIRARGSQSVTGMEKTFVHDLSMLFKDAETCVFNKDVHRMHIFEEHKQLLRDNPVDRLVPITDVLTDLVVLHAFE